MKTIINTLKTLSAGAAICAGFIVSGCKDNFTSPAAPGGNTISEVAASTDSLKAFAYALGKTGLSSNFNNLNGGTFTAFAPSNYAIVKYLRAVGLISIGKTDVGGNHAYDSAKKAIDRIRYTVYPASSKISLTGANSTISFAGVLNYHFVTSLIPSSSFTGNQVFTTLNGARLSLSKVTGGTYDYLLNADITSASGGPGANIVTVDQSASNGVLHTIDQMMIPLSIANVWDVSLLAFAVDYTKSPFGIGYLTKPGTSVITTFLPRDSEGNINIHTSASDANDGNLNLFSAALIRSNVVQTLLPNGAAILPDYTVFAPTDGAVKAYLGATTEPAALDSLNKKSPAALADLVNYHIVAGRILSTDITDGQSVSTLLTSKSIVMHVSGSAYSVTDLNSGTADASVTGINKLTNAGVVHAINTVLKSQ